MDQMKVLKRAWNILWSYKALWIFGIIVALTTSAGSGGASNSRAVMDGGGSGQGSGLITPPGDVQRALDNLGEAFERIFQGAEWRVLPAWFAWAVIALACLVLILGVVGAIARYVSETALIKMVDDYERTGEKKSVRQGFRMGWSRHAWQLFLISLIITLPIVIVALLLIFMAALPLLGWTINNTFGAIGTVAAIGLFFLVILVLIAVGVVARLLGRFAWRACTLEDLGVGEAIGRGWRMIWSNFQDVGLTWLIMVGIQIGFGILMIPVALVVVIVAGVAGGAVLLLLRGLVDLFAATNTAWIVGAVVAAPLFFLILVPALSFVSGLFKVFESSVWTLTYREIAALETLSEAGGEALPAEPELRPGVEAKGEEPDTEDAAPTSENDEA